MTDAQVAAMLRGTRRIAMVGASARPERPSHHVLAFLLDHGWDVTPVNPSLAGQSLHGCTVAASLAEAAPLDMVDIFRASAEAGAVMDEAVRLGARSLWLQLGVVDEAAAARARAAGVAVVMDRCPAIEVPRLRLEPVGAPRHVTTAIAPS